MKIRVTTPCMIALVLCMPLCAPAAFAQAGTPGMKQMRDVQRKAEQKARTKQSNNNTASQHHKASDAAATAPAAQAAPASAP